jgi:hypothetical protein
MLIMIMYTEINNVYVLREEIDGLSTSSQHCFLIAARNKWNADADVFPNLGAGLK